MATKKKDSTAAYNPISYIQAKNPGTYTSAYTNQLNAARKQMDTARNEMATARKDLMNFRYNPMQDANYQALAKIYGARGNQAAQDTLGDAASLNGGMQTSYAVSAAQQARNQYNQELAALIPDLQAQAYNRMTSNYGLLQDNYGMLQDNYNMLRDLDTEAYGRYRDTVADYQWGKGYDTDIYQYNVQQAGKGGGGGGRRRRRRRSRGGGGGYSGSGSSGTDLASLFQSGVDAVKNDDTKKKKAGGGGGNTPRVNKKAMMTK